MRSLLTLAGLVISLVLPTFAQKTNTPDPQLRQQLDALLEKTDDAYLNNDAAAAAALFTEDAVLVTPDNKTFHGREAIEKYYGDLLRKFISASISSRSIRTPLTSSRLAM